MKLSSNEEQELLMLIRLLLEFRDDGSIYWRERPGNIRFTRGGKKAGGVKNGYLFIHINGKSYSASHLVWLNAYGKLPEQQLDHRDWNPLNNHIRNLKDCSALENNQNKNHKGKGKTGVRGVYQIGNKYQASTTINHVKHYFGANYDTIEEAKKAHDEGRAAKLTELGDPSTWKQKVHAILTQQDLMEKFDYDPLTGEFFDIERGKTVGSTNRNGYIEIGINGRSFLAHRLAILYMTGAFPPDDMTVDHGNGIKTDNNFANLSIMSQGDNNRNRRLDPFKARHISYSKRRGCWRLLIKAAGKTSVFKRSRNLEFLEKLRLDKIVELYPDIERDVIEANYTKLRALHEQRRINGTLSEETFDPFEPSYIWFNRKRGVWDFNITVSGIKHTKRSSNLEKLELYRLDMIAELFPDIATPEVMAIKRAELAALQLARTQAMPESETTTNGLPEHLTDNSDDDDPYGDAL